MSSTSWSLSTDGSKGIMFWRGVRTCLSTSGKLSDVLAMRGPMRPLPSGWWHPEQPTLRNRERPFTASPPVVGGGAEGGGGVGWRTGVGGTGVVVGSAADVGRGDGGAVVGAGTTMVTVTVAVGAGVAVDEMVAVAVGASVAEAAVAGAGGAPAAVAQPGIPASHRSATTPRQAHVAQRLPLNGIIESKGYPVSLASRSHLLPKGPQHTTAVRCPCISSATPRLALPHCAPCG